MDTSQVKDLLKRYETGHITQSEKELVENWYRQLIETGEWQWKEGEKDETEKILEAGILEKIQHLQNEKPHTVYFMSRKYWWAAASVVLLLGFSAYFLFFNNPVETPQTVATPVSNDVSAPQSSKAMVTLANGQRVFLDSISNGSLAVQGNVKLMKLSNGQIVYQPTGNSNSEMQYNTLENPRGSKVINITLADGSKVWLNTGSSLTYPVAFVGKERKVSVSGEAYFEVAHDASKPFIVHNGAMNVRVLGTHFNVNAFEDDDNNIKVTLLEGSVKIISGNNNGMLKPGQQALINKEVKVLSDVDLNKVMAWKNGYFQFDKASLQSVLKQISRWYDVDVVYEGKNQPREFVGEIERDLSLKDMLKILEMNNINFVIENKKLIIKPD